METFSEADGIFLPDDNGLFAIEAETAPATGGWIEETQYPGFTGRSYYRYTSESKIMRAGRNTLSYKINVQEADDYYVTLRALRNGTLEGRDVEGDNENDFWLRVNEGPWQKFVHFKKEGEWGWASDLSIGVKPFPDPVFSLDVGVNTIEISGRSSNAMFDRLHVSKGRFNRNQNESPSPVINSSAPPPQSPTASGIDDVAVTDTSTPTQVNLFDAFDDADDGDGALDYAVVNNSNPMLLDTTIDSKTGLLSLIYAPNVEGSADITVRATDPDGLSAFTSFTVAVNLPDTPPAPVSPPPPSDDTGNSIDQPRQPPVVSPIGSPTANFIMGTRERDRLIGTRQRDIINGLGQKDTLIGRGGDDDLFGRGGGDTLKGKRGDDNLFGNGGKDRLNGGKGDDQLDGGRGLDFLKGGKGNDLFLISTGRKFDVIRDFQIGGQGGGDRLVLGLGANIRFRQLNLDNDGNRAVISLGDDVLAVLRGIDANDLSRRNFA